MNYAKVSVVLKVHLAFLFLVLLNTTDSYSSIDKDTAYARKCYALLRYYEKKYHIPQDLLFAIALQETGTPHPIHGKTIIKPWSVNVEGIGYNFESRKEAIDFVKQQIKTGKRSIDVGLMQVNILHHPHAFKSIEHAFEVRANIEYAAYFLVSKYNQFGNWAKAIAHYHSATDHLGAKYRDGVMRIAKNIDTHKSILNYRTSFKGNTRMSNDKKDRNIVADNSISNKSDDTTKQPKPTVLKLKPKNPQKNYILLESKSSVD